MFKLLKKHRGKQQHKKFTQEMLHQLSYQAALNQHIADQPIDDPEALADIESYLQHLMTTNKKLLTKSSNRTREDFQHELMHMDANELRAAMTLLQDNLESITTTLSQRKLKLLKNANLRSYFMLLGHNCSEFFNTLQENSAQTFKEQLHHVMAFTHVYLEMHMIMIMYSIWYHRDRAAKLAHRLKLENRLDDISKQQQAKLLSESEYLLLQQQKQAQQQSRRPVPRPTPGSITQDNGDQL